MHKHSFPVQRCAIVNVVLSLKGENMSTSELSGSWTYRSFNPTYVPGDHFTARNREVWVQAGLQLVRQWERDELELIRAEAELKLETPTSPTGLQGTFEWEEPDPSDPNKVKKEGLNLNGTVLEGELVSFEMVGTGRPRTRTADWEYRYHGHLTPHWPKPPNASGVEQRPALVGSVIRVKAHNGVPIRSPAGEVFSFIAVKQQPPFSGGLSGLWTYRSFLNDPAYFWEYKLGPQNLGELILQEAVFKLETPTSTTLQGTIELPDRVRSIGDQSVASTLFLDIDVSRGTLRPVEGGEPPRFAFGGIGRPGTETAGWEFYYEGHLTRHWPKPPNASGVEQRPALVGSVIWAKPQVLLGGIVGAPAGYVAPFIAVKR
jgi:hypothetical protein